MDDAATDFEQAKMGARDEYSGMTLHALAEHMKLIRAEKDELEARLKIVNAKYDVLRYEAIPNRMDEDGVERVSYEGIGRVNLTADMFVSTRDKNGLYLWLENNGLGDIIQPSVNASTLKAFIKGRMKDGKEVPAEFVNITPVTRASITKG